MRKTLVVLLIAASCIACSNDGGGGSGTTVAMSEGHRFEPQELTVSAGDTVTWTNDSSEAHTVTAYDDELPQGADYFASGGASDEDQARDEVADGLIDPDATFEVTFDEPGTYRYFCIPHESQGMVGTIVVEGK